MIWHLLSVDQWRAADAIGYVPGAAPFVHASPDLGTLLTVANALYREAAEPMVALGLDEDKLTSPVRYEPADPAPPPGAPDMTLFPHIYGPVDMPAVTEVRFARRDPAGVYTGFDVRPATAEALDLLPHPEGGWFSQTWASPVCFTPAGYPGPRAAATLIYFLLTPGEESRRHRVRSDEIWLWHAGGPLTLLAGDEIVVLGPDAGSGQRPHHVVPGGAWQAARPAGDSEVLVSCVVAPGFDFADFEVQE